MQNIIYTPELTGHLQIIRKTAQEFSKAVEGKSPEQFLAEIEVIKSLLEEAKDLASLSLQPAR